jgi:AcrR family transcriptional regulator
MPRPSRKADVLAAATACFAELGYDNTRTRDIARRAGMSEASIYRHFASLDDLALQVYSANLAEYASLIEASTLDPDDAARPLDPEPALRAVVRATLARYRAERVSFIATLVRTPSFMPKLSPGTVYPLELVESVIRRGQDARTIRPGQPNLLAALFLGALLRPFLLAELAAPGAFELLTETVHDSTIEDASIATLFPHS